MRNYYLNNDEDNELQRKDFITIHTPSFVKNKHNNTNDNRSSNLIKLSKNFSQNSKITHQYSSLLIKNSSSIRNNYVLVEIINKNCDKKNEIKENEIKQKNEPKKFKSNKIIKPYVISNTSNKKTDFQPHLPNTNFFSRTRKIIDVDLNYNRKNLNENEIKKSYNKILKYNKINLKKKQYLEEKKKNVSMKTIVSETGESKLNERDTNTNINKRKNHSFKSINLSKIKINHSNAISQNESKRHEKNLINLNDRKQEKKISNSKNINNHLKTNIICKEIEPRKNMESKEIANQNSTAKKLISDKNLFCLEGKNKDKYSDSKNKNNLLQKEKIIHKENYDKYKLKILTDNDYNNLKLNESVFNLQMNKKCSILDTELAQIDKDKTRKTEKTNINKHVKKLENKNKAKKYNKRYKAKNKNENKKNGKIINIGEININNKTNVENTKNEFVYIINDSNFLINSNNDIKNENSTITNDNSKTKIKPTIKKIEVPKINLKLINNTISDRIIPFTNNNFSTIKNNINTNIINTNLINTNNTTEISLRKKKIHSVPPLKINYSTSNLQKRETVINKNNNMVFVTINSFPKKRIINEPKTSSCHDLSIKQISLSAQNNISTKYNLSTQNNLSTRDNISINNISIIDNKSIINNIQTQNNISIINDEINSLNKVKTKIYNDGKYIGNLVEDKREGHGIMEYTNGAKYEGEWKNDKKNGKGIYISSNFNKHNGMTGLKYEGDYYDDKMEGWGTGIYTNGDRYEGEWKDNKQYGRGVVYYLNGGKYDGEWVNGKFNGFGIYYLRNGERYEGKFLNSKYHGYGKYYLLNGDVLEGIFNNDRPTRNNIMHKADGTTDTRHFNGYL